MALALTTGCRSRRSFQDHARTTAGRISLRPAAEARPDLLATVVVPRPQPTLARTIELMKAVGTPRPPIDLRIAAAAALKSSALALTVRAAEGPIAAVVLPAEAASVRPAVVVATQLGQAPERLGTLTARRLDALEIAAPGVRDRSWLLERDGVTFVADSEAALVAGAALALEMHATMDPRAATDVAVRIFPEALARDRGMDLTMLVYQAKENLKAALRTALGREGGAAHFSAPGVDDAALDVLAGRAVEVASAGLELTVDPRDGITLGVRLWPKANTALARNGAVRSPQAFDPLAAIASPAGGGAPPAAPLMLAAAGTLPVVADLRRAATAAIAGRDTSGAGAAWSALVERLAAMLAGRWSGSADAGPHGVGYQHVLALRDDVDPANAIELVAEIAESPLTRALLTGESLAPGPAGPVARGASQGWTVKRHAGRLYLEVTPASGGSASKATTLPRKIRGGDGARAVPASDSRLQLALGATPGRLLVASGPDAPARLGRMLAAARAGAAPPSPSGPLSQTLDRNRDKDAVLAFALAPNGALPPGLAALGALAGPSPAGAMPFSLTLQGGSSLGLDLHVPTSTIARVAQLKRLAAESALSPGTAPARP